MDFSKFKTYQILKQKHGFPVGANPINRQRIDRAIVREMNSLGFDTAKEPDLLVAWFVKIKNIEEVNVYHNYYGRWSRGSRVDVNRYQQGTLVLDIIDRSHKQVVWHGSITDQVYKDMPDVEEKINEAIAAMFAKFEKDARLVNSYAMN